MKKPNIRCFYLTKPHSSGVGEIALAIAIDGDGKTLTLEKQGSAHFAMKDILLQRRVGQITVIPGRLDANRHRKRYEKRYPNGYNLVDCNNKIPVDWKRGQAFVWGNEDETLLIEE